METNYIVTASTKGFAEAGRALDDLNKRAAQGQQQVKRTAQETRAALDALGRDRNVAPLNRQLGPAGNAGGMTPSMPPPGRTRRRRSAASEPPDPRLTGTQGFGPAYDPQDLPTEGSAAAPRRKRVPKKPLPFSTQALHEIEIAYNKATAAATRLTLAASDVNSVIAAGVGDAERVGAALGGMGGGRRGGGAGGGGRVPPPTPPPPADIPAVAKKSERAAAFFQGLLESAIPGMGIIQRGQGAMSQFAGRTLGNFGLNALRAPFSGIGGVQGLAASVPLVGGILGDAFGQSFGNAGTALGFEAQQQSLLPYLGRSGTYRRNLGATGPANLPFNAVGGMGRRLGGLSAASSQAFLGALAQASGGLADDPRIGNMFESSLAAQTAYGVSPGVAGAFAQGQRLQGNRAGVGQQGFVNALATGVDGLGLRGSELTEYMQQMAEDIASFRQTGIPLATDSIGALGMSLRADGISGSRAAMLAGNFQRSAQQVGMSGPNSAADFMLLQAASGRQLGGVHDEIQAMRALQRGQDPASAQRTFQNLLRLTGRMFGGGELGMEEQRRYLNQNFGLNLNSDEFAQVSRGGGRGGLSGSQLQAFANRLQGEATGNVSSALSQQAGMDNQSLSLGMQGLQQYFASERFHKELASGIVSGISPFFAKLTQLSEQMVRFTTSWTGVVARRSPDAAAGMRR